MDWLDEELRQALERKMPSADFAERVIAAAKRPRPAEQPRTGWGFNRTWLAAAASVALLVGGAAEYREYRGRQAKERVLLALRITSGTLNRIQYQAQKASRRAPREAQQ